MTTAILRLNTRRQLLVPLGIGAIALALFGGAAYAQFEEEDPLGAEAPAAAEPADVAAAPADAAAAVALDEMSRRFSVVKAALDLPRETPSQKMRTVVRLLDLGHPEAAALVLPELLAEQLDDAGRAALVREFGSARFLAFIRLDSPNVPEGATNRFAGARDFAQQCLDAAAAEASDPKRLAAIIAQLNAATDEERYAAQVDLRATGDAGMIAAFQSLADAGVANKSAAVRTNFIAGLAGMRPAVDAPTLAVLAEGKGPPVERRDRFRQAWPDNQRCAVAPPNRSPA